MSTYIEGEIPTVVAGGNSNNDGIGNGWWGIIALVVVAAIFGRNGGIFGGGNQGGVTQADLCTALNFNNTDAAVRSLQSGLCDGFYAVNTGLLNGFAGVQQTLCQGFGGVNNAITTQGYQNQLAMQGISSQLASCCCDIERGIDRLSCQSATDTAAIIQAGKDNTQAILGYLCNEKISSLQSENALLTAQLSQNAQTRTIIDSIRQVPVPSYVVPNPYTGSYGYVGYGSCGCNSGCACGAFGF